MNGFSMKAIFYKKVRTSSFSLALVWVLTLSMLFTGCGSSSGTGESETNGAAEEQVRLIDVDMEGGSGRASIQSPALIHIVGESYTAEIVWSSPNYDYMIMDGEKYLPVNTEGNSVFELPVKVMDEPIEVIGDTTAMGTPHEITYHLTFHKDSIRDASDADGAKDEDADGSGQIGEGEDGKADGAVGQNDGAASYIDPEDVSVQLTFVDNMELKYAKEFMVSNYEDGYALVQIDGDGAYLLVPEGAAVPEDLSADAYGEPIVVLQKPLNNIYLVASAVMDMFVSIDGVDRLRFSGLKENSWYLEEAKQAMADGKLLYAGKYSAPDYERIFSEKCGLAIESTMIYHTPEVKEQLEKFGIPVLVDHSSYEKEPLARMEWVKLYGLLIDKQEEAEAAWEKQADTIAAYSQGTDTSEERPIVAFFYISNSGTVNVRKSSDYLPAMISMAGGQYIFTDIGNDSSSSSTVSLQMEEFYAAAKDADYIIYNATTSGEVANLEQLLGKSSLLANFKAVKDGKVFGTSKNLYQASMELGTVVKDLQMMLSGDYENMEFLYPLK